MRLACAVFDLIWQSTMRLGLSVHEVLDRLGRLGTPAVAPASRAFGQRQNPIALAPGLAVCSQSSVVHVEEWTLGGIVVGFRDPERDPRHRPTGMFSGGAERDVIGSAVDSGVGVARQLYRAA